MIKGKTILTTASLAALTVATSLGATSVVSAHGVETQQKQTSTIEESQSMPFQGMHVTQKTDRQEKKSLFQQRKHRLEKRLRNHRQPHKHRKMARDIKKAIQDNDYEAFQRAIAKTPQSNKITEEEFSVIVQAHVLIRSGDKESAKTLLKESGIKRPFHHRERKFRKNRKQHKNFKQMYNLQGHEMK